MGSSLTLFDVGPEPEEKKRSKKTPRTAAPKTLAPSVPERVLEVRDAGNAGSIPAESTSSKKCASPWCSVTREGKFSFCLQHQAMLPIDVQRLLSAARRDENAEATDRCEKIAIRIISAQEHRDSPEVTARIESTLRSANSEPEFKESSEKPKTAWQQRLDLGAGPLPTPGNNYPRTVPVESLKDSHPEIFERYKRGPADNHIPLPACLAREVDEEFRKLIAEAQQRTSDLKTPLREFRRKSSRQLWLARAREILRLANLSSDKLKAHRSRRMQFAKLDDSGRMVDTETGEVLSQGGIE